MAPGAVTQTVATAPGGMVTPVGRATEMSQYRVLEPPIPSSPSEGPLSPCVVIVMLLIPVSPVIVTERPVVLVSSTDALPPVTLTVLVVQLVAWLTQDGAVAVVLVVVVGGVVVDVVVVVVVVVTGGGGEVAVT